MSAVSSELRQAILELQELPSVSKFSLGGGTNLALRYSHRISIDIDFISPEIIPQKEFQQIISEIQNYFGSKLIASILINQDLGEQFMFLRMLIKAEKEIIKVEFLQNMKCLFETEIVEEIRLIHKKDIGLFKLMSATNRFAKKDIYELDFITDEISLTELFNLLSDKRKKFSLSEHQCLFCI